MGMKSRKKPQRREVTDADIRHEVADAMEKSRATGKPVELGPNIIVDWLG